MSEPASPARELTVEEILGASDLQIVEVEVPEWGGSVYLRVLPADVGVALNEKISALDKKNQHESIFLLLGACLCRKDGAPLFESVEAAGKLRGRSQKVLIKLQKMALELQGWTSQGPPAKNA